VGGFSQDSLRVYAELYTVCDGLVVRWTAGAAAQRAWHGRAAAAAARFAAVSARLRDEGGDDEDNDDCAGTAGAAMLAVTPSCQVLPLCAEDAPVEAMLGAMRALLGAGQRLLASECARVQADSSAAGGAPVPAPVAVSQAEYADALRDGAAVAAADALLLAQLRVAASLHEYAAACELLAAQLTTYAGAASAAMRAREQWSAQLLAGGVAAQAPSQVGRCFPVFVTPQVQEMGGAAGGGGADDDSSKQGGAPAAASANAALITELPPDA
jgi:hypothetical protein